MRTHQRSFGGGEIVPELLGRIDLNHYQTGLKTCRNFLVLPHGPVSNRPGFEMIKECQSGGPSSVRLIPFIFNTDQAYALEFGDMYMRVISEGAPVIEAGKNISGATQANPVVITATVHGYSNGDEVFISGMVGMTEINGRYLKVANQTTNTFEVTDLQGNNIDGSGYIAYSSGGTAERVYTVPSPFAHADLFGIHFKQSEDVMTITHPDYDTRELTRLGATNWTFSTISFGPTLSPPTNLVLTKPASSGTDRAAYIVTAVDEEILEESLASVGTAITNISQANPAVVTSPSHGLINGDDVIIADVVGMEEVNGRLFNINGVTTDTFNLISEDSTGYNAYSSGGVWRQALQNDLSGASNTNLIAWDKVVGAIRYNIYKADDTTNGLFGYIGQTYGVSFEDDNIIPDLLTTPPEDNQPFNASGDRPAEVSYYGQRRIFAGTDNKPATTWMTRSGTESNLSKSIPSQDDDAIIFRLKSGQYNRIRHFVPLDALLIFTDGGEWVVALGTSDALTPNTVRDRLRPQSNVGASNLSPLVVDDAVLFVGGKGSHVHEVLYSFETGASGGYKPRDISILAPHFVDGFTIKDWDYSKTPVPINWSCRSDGTLLSMTYIPGKNPNILAWSRSDTYRGDFESCCVVPENNGESSLYVVIKRNINGVTRRFIERLHTRSFSPGYLNEDGKESFEIEDSFFVDSGLSWDNPITISGATRADPVVITATAHGLTDGDRVRVTEIESGLDSAGNAWGMSELNGNSYKINNSTANTFELQSDADTPVDIDGTGYGSYESGGVARKKISEVGGLWHLIGETVAVLADGNVHTPQVVNANGKINLLDGNGNPLYYSRIHIGLAYESHMETLPITFQQVEAFGAGRMKNVSKVFIRVNRTKGFTAGPDLDNLSQYAHRTNEAYGEPTRMISEEVEMNIESKWQRDGSVHIKQTDPLPLTVLSMALEVETGD